MLVKPKMNNNPKKAFVAANSASYISNAGASKSDSANFLRGLEYESSHQPLSSPLRELVERIHGPYRKTRPELPEGLNLNAGSLILYEHRWTLSNIPPQYNYVRRVIKACIVCAGVDESVGSECTVSSFGMVVKIEPSQREGNSPVATVVFPVFYQDNPIPFTSCAIRISSRDPVQSELFQTLTPRSLIRIDGQFKTIPAEAHWDSCVFVNHIERLEKPSEFNVFGFVPPDALKDLEVESGVGTKNAMQTLFIAAGLLEQSDLENLSGVLLLPECFERFLLYPASTHPNHQGAHHASKHGLVVHTIQVVRQIYSVCDQPDNNLRSQAMLLGWLHDIGKTRLYRHVVKNEFVCVRQAEVSHEIVAFEMLDDSGQYQAQRNGYLRQALLYRAGSLFEIVNAADRLSAKSNSMNMHIRFNVQGEGV
jgi:hypothetical protein